MGFFNIFDPLLQIIFGQLLNLSPFLGLFLISFCISLFITLIYKLMTDQDLMKQLKEEMKAFQTQIKELRNHPDKMLEVQKKAMETNMKYMTQSLRPTLVTFIPIIIIFGWMSSNLAYHPLIESQTFTVDLDFVKDFNSEVKIVVPDNMEVLDAYTQEIINRNAQWKLKGTTGEYEIQFVSDEELIATKGIIITNERLYKNPKKTKKTFIDYIYSSNDGNLERDSPVIKVETGNLPIKPFGEFSIFGWKPGWLGTYILCSIFFSIFLRKIMKLH